MVEGGRGSLKSERKRTGGGGGQDYLYVRSVKNSLKRTYAEEGRRGGAGTCKMNRNEQGGGGGQKLETSSERTF